MAEYKAEQERKEEERKAEFERQQKENEADQTRRDKQRKARLATFDRILEHAPTVFTATLFAPPEAKPKKATKPKAAPTLVKPAEKKVTAKKQKAA